MMTTKTAELSVLGRFDVIPRVPLQDHTFNIFISLNYFLICVATTCPLIIVYFLYLFNATRSIIFNLTTCFVETLICDLDLSITHCDIVSFGFAQLLCIL